MKFNHLSIRNPLLYVILSISGLTFWFFIGFPFAHHNESFLWEPELAKMSVMETLTSQITPVASYRPLGILTAWLTFTLTGDSIVLQQLINFLGALIAWLIIHFVSIEKRLFSWVALLVCGGFFSGYIYLFHLHGVFYSPLLILVAYFIFLANKELTSQGLIFSMVLTGIVSLFHTFALLIYLGFLIGTAIDHYRQVDKHIRRILVVFILILLLSIFMVLPKGGQSIFDLADILSSVLVSFAMVEVMSLLSVLSFMLTLITILNSSLNVKQKIGGIIISTLLIPVLILNEIPVILMWISFCLLKAIICGRWSFAGIISSSAILPIATGTGSPTYTIFTIFICAFMTAYRSRTMKWPISEKIRFVEWALVISILLTTAVLRSEIRIPFVTKLATPLLAEKEKTHQLANILEWIKKSGHTNYQLSFTERAGSPSQIKNAVNRRNRPPAIASEVEYYLRQNKNIPTIDSTLLISFGAPSNNQYNIVYQVQGKYNGPAIVYQIP